MIYLKRLFFKLLGRTPASEEMVQYWKRSEAVEAKVTTIDGYQVMWMAGEKYPFPGFPRGHILFGKLSKLKHEIKNQIFNDSWKKLDDGDKDVAERVKHEVLPRLYELLDGFKYDLIPPEKMCPPVRELHRAWSVALPDSNRMRDMVCLILQEDDAYRFRFQWMVPFMKPWMFRFFSPIPFFLKALTWLEHGEVIGDMKERVRLVRRVMGALLEDTEIRASFTKLFREINWSKVKMGKAEKYFFRGKYFKVDLDKYDY